MAEVLGSGHVITDEDVDTARLIMDLDRALGRTSDSLTQQVATTPTHRVRTVLDEPATPARSLSTNGHRQPQADDLVRTLTSEENAAELAREVSEELPVELDPAEQARVLAKIESVIRRRMIKLVAGMGSGS